MRGPVGLSATVQSEQVKWSTFPLSLYPPACAGTNGGWAQLPVPARDFHRGLTFQRTLPLPEGMRGWRAPGECRAVVRKDWGGARRAPAAAIFLPSPGELCAPHSRGVQALRAAGRSADGPAGVAPRAGLRIRGAGAPLPAPPNERLRTAPLIERGCRSI